MGEGYDVIFDGGTLEHIYSPAAALENIGQCTRTGGVVVHLVPMDNMINHGFYQFSPKLFFDYYGWNKWEMLLAFYVGKIDYEWHVYKANAKVLFEGQLEFPAKPHSIFMVVGRVEGSTVGVKPTKGIYAVRSSVERKYANLRDALSQANTPAK